MTLLLVILIILLILGLPSWPYAHRWRSYGYWPAGGLSIVIVLLLLLMVLR
jgi:hypothetical protein